jgi:hypothetical protein
VAVFQPIIHTLYAPFGGQQIKIPKLRRATKLLILLAAFFDEKYEIRKVDVGGRWNLGL